MINLRLFNMFDYLPFEITCAIVDYLDIKEQCSLRRCCKYFYNNFPQKVDTQLEDFELVSVGAFKTMQPKVLYVNKYDILDFDDFDDIDDKELDIVVDSYFEKTDCVIDFHKDFNLLYFNLQLSHMTNLKYLYLCDGFYPIDYLSKLDLCVLVINCEIYEADYNSNSGIYTVKDDEHDLEYYRRLFGKLVTFLKAKKIVVTYVLYKYILSDLGYECNQEEEFVLKG